MVNIVKKIGTISFGYYELCLLVIKSFYCIIL